MSTRRRGPGRSRPTTAVVAGLPVGAPSTVGRSRPTTTTGRSRPTTTAVAGLPVGAPSTVGRSRPTTTTGRSRPTTTAVVLVVLVVCSLVVSCSGGAGTQATATARGTDPGAAAGGAASPTPTPTASALPSLSAEHQALRDAALATEEPVRPEGMDENTPDGLAVATGYFLDLFPYVFATGDLTAWEEMSEDDCVFCNSVIDSVTELHANGGWADPWEQQTTLVSYGTDPQDPNRYVVTASISSPAHAAYSGDPVSPSEIEAKTITFLLQLYWHGSEWVVEEGESQ